MHSQEFYEEMRKYMLRFTHLKIKDHDKAEDIVQYAWSEAMKKIELDRTEKEIENYLITAVKLVLRDQRRISYATGTNIHDADNLAVYHGNGEELDTDLDGITEYHIKVIDPKFEEFESTSDIIESVNKTLNTMKEKEKKFLHLIISGASRYEASATCGFSHQFGSAILGKFKKKFQLSY